MKKLLLLITALALFAGCANQGTTELVPINKTVSCSKPYILYEGSCCLDANNIPGCDYLEKQANETTTTQTTQAQASNETTTTLAPQDPCSNKIKDAGELGIDCGGSCQPCKNPCDLLIKDSIIKPAARTTKICLASNIETEYGEQKLWVERRGETLAVKAEAGDGSIKESELSREKDAYIDNTIIRLIGTARNNTVTYAAAYAWTVEGGIKCSTHGDCGPDETVSEDVCINGRQIIRQFLTYRCISPGTILSSCQATQKQETIEACGEKETCVPGETECFLKECYNELMDKDEDGVDCGGSCRPCHCFNSRKDSGELGIDCSGDCVPCKTGPELDKQAPWVRILSPQNKTYNTDKINLSVSLNEEGNCSYSLNGGTKTSMNRLNITLFAQRGQNQVTVYCSDNAGNLNQSRQTFSVSLIRAQTCQEDNVSNDYTERADQVTAIEDNELELGAADTCTPEVFDYSLTYIPDSGRHAGTKDITLDMSDGNLTSPLNAPISYECTSAGRLRIAYLRLRETDASGLSKAAALIYFTEGSSPGLSGHWRVHAQAGDEADLGSYIDIPYRPLKSSCAAGLMYQELDLSSLASSGKLDIRIGLYSSSISSGISIKEIEVSKKKK